jgi:hypothetical protein
MDACTRRQYSVDTKDEIRAGPHACSSTKAVGCAMYPGDITRAVRSARTPGVTSTGCGRSRHESLSRLVNTRLSDLL